MIGEHWGIAAAMAAGSYVAGSTPMGGGTVGFPVLVLLFDQSGAIGRRYRRADEAGVPYALTVDFDTLEGDGTITLRDRDTTEQQRMSVDKAVAYLEERINP